MTFGVVRAQNERAWWRQNETRARYEKVESKKREKQVNGKNDNNYESSFISNVNKCITQISYYISQNDSA